MNLRERSSVVSCISHRRAISRTNGAMTAAVPSFRLACGGLITESCHAQMGVVEQRAQRTGIQHRKAAPTISRSWQ